MQKIPDDIRQIIEETTHRLKTETGVCHDCKKTHPLGNLLRLPECGLLICQDCKKVGDNRLWKAICEKMGWDG